MNCKQIIILSSLFTLVSTTLSANALAEHGASHHSGQASKHSALASGHVISGTGQVASAALATPVIVLGALSIGTGSVLLSAGETIATSSNASNRSIFSNKNKHDYPNAPLHITEITITADPAPNKLPKANNNAVPENTTKQITVNNIINNVAITEKQ